jgi:hypothetical protein
MPNRLIVCFTASEQSIKGSATVAASAWAQWARLKALNHDSKTDTGQKLFPILMRTEGSEKNKLDATRAHVREVFGRLPGLRESDEDYWNKAEVGYWPFYAFEEVLAVFGDRFRTESSLLAACEHVAGLITDGSVNRLAPSWRREHQLCRTGRGCLWCRPGSSRINTWRRHCSLIPLPQMPVDVTDDIAARHLVGAPGRREAG